MSAHPLVVVDGISRYFGDLCAIDNLSIEVQRGEIIGFLGPNGAGKSTTMQIICGALAPSSGAVNIGGFDLFTEPRAAKNLIGYLPETPPLYPELTVDEYLDFTALLHGVAKAAMRDARERVKQRCAIAGSGKRLIRNLSKGYRQRVGIAQAIIHNPQVVVLDEPTEGLDPNQMREIRALIQELGREHSVILSTHLLPEVQAVCHRVLIVNEGRLVFDQSLSNIDAITEGQQQNGVAEPSNKSLRVRLSRPPPLKEWQNITGVTGASLDSDQQILVEYLAEQTTIEQLSAKIVSSGWGLTELSPNRQTLEEIFVRLTCGETVEQNSPD
jgi:ABC-2 type transport system ATP-binding protein